MILDIIVEIRWRSKNIYRDVDVVVGQDQWGVDAG